jgi:hypothetical protein
MQIEESVNIIGCRSKSHFFDLNELQAKAFNAAV